MAKTSGINHTGLTVCDLDQTTAFFVDVLGWDVTARDPDYPRNTVTDGSARLTLWQADVSGPMRAFDRRANIGLHHIAFTVPSEDALNDLASKVAAYPGVRVEFLPEFMGHGPRRHMIFAEPGGLRIELVWAGD
jgi:catechol 2,3-dioxygenase-like lactoylglutathione lyase family enzyme